MWCNDSNAARIYLTRSCFFQQQQEPKMTGGPCAVCREFE
jgi:hypothetical protein